MTTEDVFKHNKKVDYMKREYGALISYIGYDYTDETLTINREDFTNTSRHNLRLLRDFLNKLDLGA